MTHKESRGRWTKCREYKAQGHTNKEVAEHFGIAYETAKNICRGIAPQIIGHPNQNTKQTEKEKREYVEKQLPLVFSYHSGYIDCDHHVNLKCKICGTVFDVSMVSIRKGNNIECPVCKKADMEDKAKREQARKEKAKAEKQIQIRDRLIQKEAERQAKTRTVRCEVCGQMFTTLYQAKVTCSSECSKKRSNRIASHRKDSRISKDKRIDKNITVITLYQRDKGVCWICGGKCDLDDYIIKDEAFVCGDSYPSVDHVIPVCEGGEDSWQNVRLAHRHCNTKRYWEESRSPRVAV